MSITPLQSPVVPLEYGSATRSSLGSKGTVGAFPSRASERGEGRRARRVVEDEYFLDAGARRRRDGAVEEWRDRHQEARAAHRVIWFARSSSGASGLIVVTMPPAAAAPR